MEKKSKLRPGNTCYWAEQGSLAKGTVLEIQPETETDREMIIVQTEDGSSVAKQPADLQSLNNFDIMVINAYCEEINTKRQLEDFPRYGMKSDKRKITYMVMDIKYYQIHGRELSRPM